MPKEPFARVEIFVERDSVTNEVILEVITLATDNTPDEDRDIHVITGCSDYADALETAADFVRGLISGELTFENNEEYET